MAKDPAFLFYSNDFITGTYTMSDEQVGKYIRLLCLQHQIGKLTEKHMLHICRTYDEDIFSKFRQEDGFFFNERLLEESNKRKRYCESRKKNKEKKDMKNICETYEATYVQHMENENENINNSLNNNTLTIKKGEKSFPKSNDVGELPSVIIKSIIDLVGVINKVKLSESEIKSLWETFKVQYLDGTKYYANENSIHRHFINWAKNQNIKHGKSNSKTKFESLTEYSNRFNSEGEK